MTLAAAKRLSLPIADLVTQYIDSLKVQKKDPEHVRITEWMLKPLRGAGRVAQLL